MSTYYQYVNYDKREVIDLSQVTSVKSGAFSGWSLQVAILNLFLGFDYPTSGLGDVSGWVLSEWAGRWKKDRVGVVNDAAGDEEVDRWEGEFDAGMLFLAAMMKAGELGKWLKNVSRDEGWAAEFLVQGVEKWRKEHPTH